MRSDLLKKMAMAMMLGMMAFGVVACDNDDGPAEKAGESVDNAVDDAGQAMENAGDNIQDKAEDAKN
ncbi:MULTISPECIES: hypothetical protein [Salinicola]|uniref:YtxH domain-containing protein n=1 Tax=Salinicola endophyticus TaxID=1949083 RepID=A0AB74UEQ7_9GAMM|nr:MULTISPECIES: hypothetical protein [unclassified Salinicola]MCE3028151.1 hypothetical protein [Salinicola sp. DM10]WIX33499.1 hypothetical protein QO259_02240 [Salinicola sp. JS01]